MGDPPRGLAHHNFKAMSKGGQFYTPPGGVVFFQMPIEAMEIDENLWKSIGINGNLLEIAGNFWKSLEIHGNQKMKFNRNQWNSMEIIGKSMENQWKSKNLLISMEINRDERKSMELHKKQIIQFMDHPLNLRQGTISS